MAPGFSAETLWPELLAIACFLILPWIGISHALHQEYAHARSAALQSTAALARALEESTRRTIGQIDYILLSARAQRTALGERFDFHDWARTQILPDKMTAQIAMTDREGLVTASTMPLRSAVNVSDRMHFRVQVSPAHDDLFISRPLVGRVTGVEALQFTRRLLASDGRFDGIVLLSLGSDELARFYDSVKLGKGFVSIVSTDGIIMARGPAAVGLGGSTIADNPATKPILNQRAGSVELESSPTHGNVIASFRRMQDYPLVVMVAFDAESVFRTYHGVQTTTLSAGVAIDLAVGLIGFFWVRQKQRSQVSRQALAVTLDTISQGILMVDGRGDVPVINRQVVDLLGRPDELPERTLHSVAARASALIASQVAAAGPADSLASRRESKFTTTLDNGTIIEVRTHALQEGGFVQTYTDITEQRLAHAQVFHLAQHDTLTGLANRAALMRRISAIVGQDTAGDELTAIVMIDLDGFKGVNDTLGHDAGDALLVEVAGRLRGLVRGTDVVARVGGDEFGLLLSGLQQRDDILPLVERVLSSLAEPARILDQNIRVGASLGIAFHPQDGPDADTWLKHADLALYSAKTAGRGIYRCFDKQLSWAMTEHHLLERDLRKALDGSELEVYFQPKFNCRTLDIVGFEALTRWRHPTRGFVSPALFIPIAEDCGLIVRLGRWVLEQACQAVATWEPPYPVAVNVSVMQLRDTSFKDQIAAVLASTGLRPDQLELEVTESVMAEDDPAVLENLRAAKIMGIQIALDDFGTGYSSLSYLRRFPFDKIKIDRSFVQGPTEDPGMRVILEAILTMCHNLNLSTIGEGIETQAQLDMLADRGCSEVQGFLLGHPMPQDQIQGFIDGKLSLTAQPGGQQQEGALHVS